MDLRGYINKIIQVKVIGKQNNYFIASEIENNIKVYIKDDGDYIEEELIGTIEKAIVLDVKKDCMLAFLVSNRKFINDMNKINKNLLKESEYNNIKDIYLLKRLKINGKIEGLYLVEEEKLQRYYLGTLEVAFKNKKELEPKIVFKERTLEDVLKNQIKDVIQSTDLNKKEISLKLEQKKQKDNIEKVLHFGENIEISRIATVNLSQKIKDEENSENYNKIKQKNLQSLNSNIEILKKEPSTIKDVNIKQEMNTSNMVTDLKNLGQVLEKAGKMPKIEGKKFTKIGIIESIERDNLKDINGKEAKVNTTRYSMVAIANDGTVVPLEVEQDAQEGINPSERNIQVNQKGEVTKGTVLSRFKVGEGTIGINNGPYGEIKVYHSPRKTIGGNGVEGNKSLDRELETDNVWQMKREERDLAEEYGDGYRSVEDSYQEAKLHEDEKGEFINEKELNTKDIDGEINTKSHTHDNIDYNKLAVKWGYYKEGEPNYNKAKQLFEEKRKANPQKSTKEIVEMVTEDLEEDFEHNMNER